MKLKKYALFVLLFLGVFLMFTQTGFAEEAAAEGGGGKKGHNFFAKLAEGGVVMIFLAICSVIMLWLIVDGVLRSRHSRLIPPMELEKLRNFFRAGDYVGAYASCNETPCAINTVTKAGLIAVGDGKNATEETILAELTKEQSRSATRLSYLSVIGVCTPMIGLIGTVLGMIGAFDALGAGNVAQNSDKLAAAIGEVLVATATGLFIAVPAFFAYYILRNMLQGAIHEVENEAFNLFRKMPYHLLEGVHIGDQEIFANAPNWVDAPLGAEGALPVDPFKAPV